MSSKPTALGLGYFSIALGAAELLATKRIARMLGVSGKPATTVIRAFGVREIAAGTMLLRGPAVSFNVWNRVFGDMMDAAALGLAARSSNRKGAVAGALAFVGAAAVLDTLTAVALDKETGRTFPKVQTATP